jgi:WD40 repeat protein
VLALPFVPVLAADPDDAEIARLVKMLGSDVFNDRVAATKRLTQTGEPALDALEKAAASNDPEVRRRAEDIIAAIEDKLYPEHRSIGHAVTTVVVSADGKRLLTGGYDKALRLWDADTGKELRGFEGHTDAIQAVALSPDGKRVLSASGDLVRLWDAQTGKALRQMTHGLEEGTASVAFGPEGRALSGDRAGRMHLWDLNTGKKAGVFTCPHPENRVVSTVAYSETAKLAVTCGTHQPICLWNLETGKEVRKFAHSDYAHACFSPNGKRVAGIFNELLRIWDVETGKVLFGIDGVKAFCVAFSPDGKRLVTGGREKMQVWDANGKELHRYEGHTGSAGCVMFFPDGKRIASANFDGVGNPVTTPGPPDRTARIWRAPR